STATALDIQCVSGAGVGVPFDFTLDGGNTAGQIKMTVKYGKPADPTPVVDNAVFNYQFDASNGDGPASVVTNSNLGAGGIGVSCVNTTAGKNPGDPVAVGDTFDCVVAFSNLVTPGHAVVKPDAGANIGGFTTSGEDTTGLPAGIKGYLCGSGPSKTNCIGYTIHGTATAVGQVVFDQNYYALGAQGHHTDQDVNTHYFIVASTTTTLTIGTN